MQQENKKKKIIILGGVDEDNKKLIETTQKLAKGKELNVVTMPLKSLSETILEENTKALTTRSSLLEDVIYVADIGKQGVRGITNNRKLKKKRKKKGKKTHRNKKRK